MLRAVTIRSQMNFVQERMNMEEEGEEEVDEEMEKVQAVEEEKEDDVATYLSVTSSRLSLSGKPIENSFLGDDCSSEYKRNFVCSSCHHW